MSGTEIGGLCLAVGVVLGVVAVMLIAVVYVAFGGGEEEDDE